jgi:DNA-binding transcriptional regulator LsrR (DeoR family)
MPFTTRPDAYTKDSLYQVADLHFVQGQTFDKIATALGEPRAKIVAMCKAAQEGGLVRTVLLAPPEVRAVHRQKLANRVRQAFGLMQCVIVNGRFSMTTERMDKVMRDVIVDDIAEAAARELNRRFSEKSTPVLGMCGGSVVRKIVSHLPTDATAKKEGWAVAAHGVHSTKMDRLDPNDNARDIGRRYGCEWACMPLSAAVRHELVQYAEQMDQVKTVLDILRGRVNMIVGTLGTVNQLDESETASEMSHDLAKALQLEEFSDRAIGNLGAQWFDACGEWIKPPTHQVLGLSLDTARELVSNGDPVILAVGADPTRIPALAVALRTKLCNVWVGDDVTAGVLLGDVDITKNPTVKWTAAQRKVLRELQVDDTVSQD